MGLPLQRQRTARADQEPSSGTQRRARPVRESGLAVSVGMRVPVPDYPGIFKLPGKEVYAIQTDDMDEERVVRSWRTVLRFVQRRKNLPTASPPLGRPPAPASVFMSPAEELPRAARARTRTVPFDPTQGETFVRTRVAKCVRLPSKEKKEEEEYAAPEKEEEKAEEEDDDDDEKETDLFGDGNGDDESDHTVSGGARHWTTDEDNALLIGMLRVGVVVGQPTTHAQWRTITACVCDVRFRTVRQVRRRWGFLNPMNKAANEATRKRRRAQHWLRRRVAAELFPSKKKQKKKTTTPVSHGFSPVQSDPLTDGIVREVLDEFTVGNDGTELELAAIEPPLSLDDHNAMLPFDARTRRKPTDPEITFRTTNPGCLTGPPQPEGLNRFAYRFADGCGFGLGRSQSYSFVFPADRRGVDGRRKYELIAVPGVELPAAAAPMHQNQITDYMLQRKARAARCLPLLETLMEKTPSASASTAVWDSASTAVWDSAAAQ